MSIENTVTNTKDRQFTNALFFFIIAILFGLFVFQLWYHATRTSAIIDEPVHVLAGHRHWQCGDFGINPEHPPLLKLLANAPLTFHRLIDPPWECGSKMTSKSDSFLFGTKFIVQNGVDAVVVPSRLAAETARLTRTNLCRRA